MTGSDLDSSLSATEHGGGGGGGGQDGRGSRLSDDLAQSADRQRGHGLQAS